VRGGKTVDFVKGGRSPHLTPTQESPGLDMLFPESAPEGKKREKKDGKKKAA